MPWPACSLLVCVSLQRVWQPFHLRASALVNKSGSCMQSVSDHSGAISDCADSCRYNNCDSYTTILTRCTSLPACATSDTFDVVSGLVCHCSSAPLGRNPVGNCFALCKCVCVYMYMHVYIYIHICILYVYHIHDIYMYVKV